MELPSQVRDSQGTGLPGHSEHGIHLEPQVCGQCLRSVGVTTGRTRVCREPRCGRQCLRAKPRGFRHSAQYIPLTLIPTPAFPTAGVSSAERQRGGRTEGRQGANHLQRTTCLLEFKMSPGFQSQWTRIPFLFPPGEANDNLN